VQLKQPPRHILQLVRVDPDPDLPRAEQGASVETGVRGILILSLVVVTALASGGLLWGWVGAGVALGLVAVVVGALWYFSDRLILGRTGARQLAADDDRTLDVVLGELSGRAGIPAPELYLLPCPQPNAFSVGRSPTHASIVLTEGLVALLEPTDIQAVLAQQVAHIRRRDVSGASITSAMVCGVFALSELATPRAAMRHAQNDPGLLESLALRVAIGLRRATLAPGREGMADRRGSELIGDTEPLALALAKIDTYARVVPMALIVAGVSVWIVDPVVKGRKTRWQFSTGPSVSDRIRSLRASVPT
jgi:heat shock protein HtpX